MDLTSYNDESLLGIASFLLLLPAVLSSLLLVVVVVAVLGRTWLISLSHRVESLKEKDFVKTDSHDILFRKQLKVQQKMSAQLLPSITRVGIALESITE